MYDPTRPDPYRATVPGSPVAYGATVPLPPRRSRGRLVALVLGLVVLGCCVAGGTAAVVGQWLDDANTATPSGSAPGVGDPVRDGQFEFVVDAVTCGQREIVNGILRAQAQGQYCVVDLTVRNTGRDARQFADGHQRAYSPGGDRYAADTGAGVVANGNGVAVWNVINPGNTIRAKVVFDIPRSASIARVELHDSGLSGGVQVTVSSATATS